LSGHIRILYYMEEINDMKTLWVFGDSFSEDVKNNYAERDCARGDYIKKYLNGIPYEVWGDILAKKLGFKYKNYAVDGLSFDFHSTKWHNHNTNDYMINNVSYLSSKFKKDDIIFLGFTGLARISWPTDDGIECQLPNSDRSSLIKNENKVIELLMVQKTKYDFYALKMINELKTLETLSKVVGFKLFYWDWTSTLERVMEKHNLLDEKWIIPIVYSKDSSWIEKMDSKNPKWDVMNQWSIDEETNGDIQDGHPCKMGNEIHANNLYNYLRYNLK